MTNKQAALLQRPQALPTRQSGGISSSHATMSLVVLLYIVSIKPYILYMHTPKYWLKTGSTEEEPHERDLEYPLVHNNLYACSTSIYNCDRRWVKQRSYWNQSAPAMKFQTSHDQVICTPLHTDGVSSTINGISAARWSRHQFGLQTVGLPKLERERHDTFLIAHCY